MHKNPSSAFFQQTQAERMKIFCKHLQTDRDLFFVSDSLVSKYFCCSIDLILKILALNFECTCKCPEKIIIGESIFVFVNEYNTKKMHKMKIPFTSCKDLNLQQIVLLLDIISQKNSIFERSFQGYYRYVAEMICKFKKDCFSYEILVKPYKKILNFYLQESHTLDFITENFTDGFLIHLNDFSEFLKKMMTNQTFVKHVNKKNIPEKIIKQLKEGSFELLDCLVDFFEIYKKGYDTEWNFNKFRNDISQYTLEMINFLFTCDDVLYLNKIVNINLQIIKNTKIENDMASRIIDLFIRNNLFVNEIKDFDKFNMLGITEENFFVDIKISEIHLLNVLSNLLQKQNEIFYDYIMSDDFYKYLIFLFFNNEQCYYLQNCICEIIKTILQSDSSKYHSIIKKIILQLQSGLLFWGKEFFARENEKNSKITSLASFCTLIYIEILELKYRCKKNIEKKENNLEILNLIDQFIESEDFLLVKFFFDRNIARKRLKICDANSKEVNDFLDKCVSDTHVRYVQYLISQKLPECDMFLDKFK
ncbi:hypothetical protein GVAV_001441 [Gurleya vavrai]